MSRTPRPEAGVNYQQERATRPLSCDPTVTTGQAVEVAARSVTPGGRRIAALDFTKGALVLIMVLYHWLNYFVGPQSFAYRYLRFLPPSFIFIAGFLVSHVYLTQTRIQDRRTPRRLAVRGLKILAVFVFLNLLKALLSGPDYTTVLLDFVSPDRLWAVYGVGTFGAGKAASFNVLVPISYLLILSAFLLIAFRKSRKGFHGAACMLFLCVLAFDLGGIRSVNLELVAIGLAGVVCGSITIDKINKLARHPYLPLAAYGCYAVIITWWEVIYPVQIIGVCLTLLVLYIIGVLLEPLRRVQGIVNLLGRYSLFGYIAQIVIIQLLYLVFRRLELGLYSPMAALVGAAGLTTISAMSLDYLRTRVKPVDSLYRGIFG